MAILRLPSLRLVPIVDSLPGVRTPRDEASVVGQRIKVPKVRRTDQGAYPRLAELGAERDGFTRRLLSAEERAKYMAFAETLFQPPIDLCLAYSVLR